MRECARDTGAAFSLVPFSWPNKRKVPASGRNPDDVFSSARTTALLIWGLVSPSSRCNRTTYSVRAMPYAYCALREVVYFAGGHAAGLVARPWLEVGTGTRSRHPSGGEVCRTCKSRIHRPGKPGRWCLSLVWPRESHQREGHPGIARRARSLCCLLDLGGCGTCTMRPRAPTCSNSPRRHPGGQASCSARYRGPKYVNRKTAVRCAAFLAAR